MYSLPGQQFDFEFSEIVPGEDYIPPTLNVIFHRSSKPSEYQDPADYTITNMTMKLSVKQNDYNIKIIGQARSKTLQEKWAFSGSSFPEFDLTLDHSTLFEIEKLRGNGDLNLIAELHFQAYPVGQISLIESYPLSIKFSVPKSTWVEKVLSKLNYKNVALVEIPRLEYPRLNKAIDLLNRAWKSYSSGDIDDVLVKCRMVLEELKLQVMAASFVKNEYVKDKEGHEFMKKVPDWDRFLDSQSKGDIVKDTTKSMLNFVAQGAHVGGILVVNHAYFALLQTFSLTHLITSRFKMIDDMKTPGRRRKADTSNSRSSG